MPLFPYPRTFRMAYSTTFPPLPPSPAPPRQIHVLVSFAPTRCTKAWNWMDAFDVALHPYVISQARPISLKRGGKSVSPNLPTH